MSQILFTQVHSASLHLRFASSRDEDHFGRMAKPVDRFTVGKGDPGDSPVVLGGDYERCAEAVGRSVHEGQLPNPLTPPLTVRNARGLYPDILGPSTVAPNVFIYSLGISQLLVNGSMS